MHSTTNSSVRTLLNSSMCGRAGWTSRRPYCARKSTTRLIGELEREDVSSDARDAVASFLQDLRRDGVDWHSIGHGRGYFEADDERRVFPEYAAPCTRATRIPGSVCMKFAHEHGAPWDQWTCAYAADFGNLQSLQYAHEHGCPWDVSTCQAAAEYGHLDCLRYARENGCPWNWATCALPPEWTFEMLKYAREHGCDWTRGRASLPPEWTLGLFEVRARERVSLERGDVRECRREWTFGVFEVRARERVSLGRGDVRACRLEWTLGLFAIRARERVSLGRADVRQCRQERILGLFAIRARERVSLEREGRAAEPPSMDNWSV